MLHSPLPILVWKQQTNFTTSSWQRVLKNLASIQNSKGSPSFGNMPKVPNLSDLCKILGTEQFGTYPSQKIIANLLVSLFVILSHNYFQNYLAVSTFTAILNKKLQRRHSFPQKGWFFVSQQEILHKFLLSPILVLNPHVWKCNSICQLPGSWRPL